MIEGKLGLGGLVRGGEVLLAFPFVRGGYRYQMEVLRVISDSSTGEGWIWARYQDVEIGFYHTFHPVQGDRFRKGDKAWFVLNGLALSLRRVEPYTLPVEWEGEAPFSTTGHRLYVPSRKGSLDEGIFQSTIGRWGQRVRFEERSFYVLPLALSQDEDKPTVIDLYVTPELMETMGSPAGTDEEIAGVFWLQGYAPEVLESFHKRPL
mgnify:CR=1 FL=1